MPKPSTTTASGITREAALIFLLSYIVVDQAYSFKMTPTNLFNLMNLASEAETTLKSHVGLIPHELIETLAKQFIETQHET
ncbi:MAG: hypothetical protein KUG79_07440 [Pseudomonadales bacterium]|nr:hypothetical protein [Pseudomonadales bacterium]